MSLKQEIETWVQALAHYDQNEFESALSVFSNIADTSKILFNCGVIHATIGEHDRAVCRKNLTAEELQTDKTQVDCYQRAIGLDQYLAVAYFQEGVSNFLVGDFEEALANFNDTLLYLRGNTFIDYEQLGLKFKLYSCEVLFNRGLCYIYLQQEKPGMQDFSFAVKEKMTPDHDVIDEAIRERAQGYTVFSIPVGVVYRPNEAKVKNLKTKDYLGKARLVATANVGNLSTGFTGADQKEAQAILLAAKDDRLPENISFAATNLVQRNMSSRGREREQSAPPSMGRPAFPPTPPPEADKPSLTRGNSQNIPIRTSSTRNSNPRNPPPPLQLDRSNNPTPAIQPLPLELNLAQPQYLASTTYSRNSQSPQSLQEQGQWTQPLMEEPLRPRLGTMRSMSETRRPNITQQTMDRSNSLRGTPRLLYGERTPLNQQNTFGILPEEQEQFAEVYDMYSTPPRSNKDGMKSSRSTKRMQEPVLIEEEDEDDIILELSSESQEDVVFKPSHSRTSSRNNLSSSATTTRRSSRPKPEMRKIRVKVHFTDDIRYIMIPNPTIDFDDFESRVREKFGIKGRMRMKIREMDDEDLVTMGDQDDLEMLVAGVKAAARKERSEMGKMEVWVQVLEHTY